MDALLILGNDGFVPVTATFRGAEDSLKWGGTYFGGASPTDEPLILLSH